MLEPGLKIVFFDLNDKILTREEITRTLCDMGISSKECLVVSNDDNNIKVAQSMGIACIGHIDNRETFDFGVADYLIESLESVNEGFVRMVHAHSHNLPYTIAHTKRLKIREMVMEDVDVLSRLITDCEFTVFSENVGEEEIYDYFRAYISNVYRFYGFGIYALLDSLDNLIGFAGVNEKGELGYIISEEYRRKGYAKEAIPPIIDYVLENSDFDEIIAKTDEANMSSCALLESLSFLRDKGDRRVWRRKRTKKNICI